jgi:transposase InsO family protein
LILIIKEEIKETTISILSEWLYIFYVQKDYELALEKIERFLRIFEEQFFRKYKFLSNKDFNLKLMDWLVFYNIKRKHWWIKYITPMQKLEILFEKKLVCL